MRTCVSEVKSVNCLTLFYGDCSSVGRASDCGSDGRGFEPRHSPHFPTLANSCLQGFLLCCQQIKEERGKKKEIRVQRSEDRSQESEFAHFPIIPLSSFLFYFSISYTCHTCHTCHQLYLPYMPYLPSAIPAISYTCHTCHTCHQPYQLIFSWTWAWRGKASL